MFTACAVTSCGVALLGGSLSFWSQMDALLTCMMQNKDYYEDQLAAMFSGPEEAKSKEDSEPLTEPNPEVTNAGVEDTHPSPS
jgi:hypothetical protein